MKKQPHPTDIALGRRIRMARMAGGVSQEKLAAAIGISFQQVQKYEKGVNRVGASRMVQIGAALNIAPEALLKDIANDAGGAAALPVMARDQVEVARLMQAMTPAMRRGLVKVARAMTGPDTVREQAA